VPLLDDFDALETEDGREAGGTTKAWIGAKRMNINVDKNLIVCIVGFSREVGCK
jgi:hypothetical protein